MAIDQKLYDRIAKTEDNLFEICRDNSVTYYELHKLASQDEEVREKLQDALTSRALHFFEKIREMSEAMQDFYYDAAGKRKPMRNNVQKVRLQIDVYRDICSQLAPRFFSDHAKEIKELEKRLKALEDKKK